MTTSEIWRPAARAQRTTTYPPTWRGAVMIPTYGIGQPDRNSAFSEKRNSPGSSDNVFHAFDYPVLYAKSVDGLTFSNNRIVRSTRYQPYHRRKHMLNLEYCRNVKVVGNRLEGDVLGRDIHIEKMNPSEVTVAPGQGISGP